jgi:hypothetical protein
VKQRFDNLGKEIEHRQTETKLAAWNLVHSILRGKPELEREFHSDLPDARSGGACH